MYLLYENGKMRSILLLCLETFMSIYDNFSSFSFFRSCVQLICWMKSKKRSFSSSVPKQIQNTEHVSFSINKERMKILQWNEWMNHESFILHGKIYIILEKNSYCDFCKFVNITSCVGLFKGVEVDDNFHGSSVFLFSISKVILSLICGWHPGFKSSEGDVKTETRDPESGITFTI
jgi:hypothetical protein